MDIDLVAVELEIRTNGSLPCEHFSDFLLSQQDFLNKMRPNEKFDTKKCISYE